MQNIDRFLQSLVKLPPIKLPSFNGQYSTWLEFKDAFMAMVHNSPGLNDIQKFYYLRASLDRDVLEIIKSIEVSASNYTFVWQFLIDRFENKKLIIHNHIRAIFEQPNIIKESYVDLRNLFDSITKHLRSLKTLGEQTDSWDRLIIYIITSKLDLITRRDWETYRYEGDLPTIKDLNNFLKSKCEILEKLEVSCQNNSGNSDKWGKSGAKFGNSRKHSTVCSSTEARDINLKFYYCSKAHSIYKCESFLNLAVNDRIAEIKRHKLCLNCLGSSHPSWKCTRPKCYKCKRAHNSLLHSESYSEYV